MKRFNEKLKLILVPFLVISVSIIAGYTFLHWFLFIKLHTFSWKEETLNMTMPWVLPWIPILIWLRPRIKLLDVKKGRKSDPVGFYICISGMLIAIPTMIAQRYLETATGKLTALTNINQIDKQEATKYYTLKEFYLDKTKAGTKDTVAVTDKRKNYVDMNLYLALPLLSSADDTLGTRCIAWYGIQYHKQIRQKLSEDERQYRLRQFVQESRDDFDKKNVSPFIYLDRIGNSDDHDEYIAAIKQNPKYSTNSTTVLIPVNEPFAERNKNGLAWLLVAFAIGPLIWLIVLRTTKLNDAALAKFNSGGVERSTDAAYDAQPQNT